MEASGEYAANHGDAFDKKGASDCQILVIGGALLIVAKVFLYRVYRFVTLETQLRRWKIPFALYPLWEWRTQPECAYRLCGMHFLLWLVRPCPPPPSVRVCVPPWLPHDEGGTGEPALPTVHGNNSMTPGEWRWYIEADVLSYLNLIWVW
jgi:hypothetical protein